MFANGLCKCTFLGAVYALREGGDDNGQVLLSNKVENTEKEILNKKSLYKNYFINLYTHTLIVRKE